MKSQRLIIDVRESFEYESYHVDGALSVPVSELISGVAQLSDVDRDTELIVYCRTGSRSSVAIQVLERMGFSSFTNGINAGHVEKNYLNNSP